MLCFIHKIKNTYKIGFSNHYLFTRNREKLFCLAHRLKILKTSLYCNNIIKSLKRFKIYLKKSYVKIQDGRQMENKAFSYINLFDIL